MSITPLLFACKCDIFITVLYARTYLTTSAKVHNGVLERILSTAFSYSLQKRNEIVGKVVVQMIFELDIHCCSAAHDDSSWMRVKVTRCYFHADAVECLYVAANLCLLTSLICISIHHPC